MPSPQLALGLAPDELRDQRWLARLRADDPTRSERDRKHWARQAERLEAELRRRLRGRRW